MRVGHTIIEDRREDGQGGPARNSETLLVLFVEGAMLGAWGKL